MLTFGKHLVFNSVLNAFDVHQIWVRNSRLRLAGIWMVSRATAEGVKTSSSGKIFLMSINNVGQSALSFKAF